jgi:hypothetical protein
MVSWNRRVAGLLVVVLLLLTDSPGLAEAKKKKKKKVSRIKHCVQPVLVTHCQQIPVSDADYSPARAVPA